MTIQERFNSIINTNSHEDIKGHMQTLYEYAKKCKHITEFGTRTAGSSTAFALARPDLFVMYDIDKHVEAIRFFELCCVENVNFKFCHKSTLETDIEATDLLFIDTWHVYQQLKQELALHASKVRHYIIMHDTETFASKGETEGHVGLKPALDEFLAANPQWKVKEHFKHCNGLTVLERQ